MLAVADPVHVAQPMRLRAQRLARADHDAARARHRAAPHRAASPAAIAEAAPLADGEMDDAGVAPEHAAVEIDDLARLRGARLQPLDDVGVAAGRHEADVLAVVLVGDRKAELRAPARASRALVVSPSGKRSMSSCSRVVANRK